MIEMISKSVIPVMILTIVLLGLFKDVDVFDSFVTGGEKGLKVSVKILPSIIGLLVAVGMMRASGALDLLVNLLSPVSTLFHIPKEVMPLTLLRPISGSGTTALVTDMINTYGADSQIGRIAAVMAGSSETTFYTIAVYFGAVKVKNIRYTLVCALVADFMAAVLSVFFVNMIYGY